MRKKELREGDEYIVSVPGGRRRARLVRVDHMWSCHDMEVTDAPKGSRTYRVGERMEVHSKSIKYPNQFVITEEP